MRRVVYVCTDPGIPVFGSKGASVHVRAVLRRLVAAGLEVDLITPRTGGDAPPDLAQVRVHLLPQVVGADPADRERSAQASEAGVAALLDTIADDGPIDLVYERYALWGRTSSAWAQRRGIRSILEVNAPLVHEHADHRGLVHRDGAEQVARQAIGRAGAVVCVTESVARWARSCTPTPERVQVIANGVDTHRITPSPAPPVPAATDPFTVGFVGTLKPWHGVDVLIDAMALLIHTDPSYRLLVVGHGPQAAALAERARGRAITGAVEFTGAVDPDEIAAMLRRMAVATAPYPPMRDCYFSPLKVQEYLAAGVPVVASRIGVLPEVLDDGRLGELVAPGDPDELAGAIASLRADAGRRAQLRRDAVQAARAHDWDHVVRRAVGLVGLTLPVRRDDDALV
ncbi:glycosyltransferase family 4 protein [Ruania alba]|uniref:D-inositol 3-phosphate glycosyltransferase n=1 Tax=Ruania alba TaxID=648782 RepID=A0A1H5N1P2_9MICO|nr:glycosyltransferase family 4 protein [Ruania alba]SEE95463.1 Glycosyltransferase involved in cell wall bisynthesis [Ruania alba]